MFPDQLKLCLFMTVTVIGLVHGKDYYRPNYGRAVYPLIPLEKSRVLDEEPPPPPALVEPPPPPGIAERLPPQPNDGFIETSNSNAVFCQTHADCYGYREPDDWCPPPSGSVWRDRGCYCDRVRSNCIIDRTIDGDHQWSYCTSKGDSRC